MQTFVQICKGLGYADSSYGYLKMHKAGVDLASLPRFASKGGHELLYDEETAKYIESVIGPKKQGRVAYKRSGIRKAAAEQKKVEVKTEVSKPEIVSDSNKAEVKSAKKAAKAVKKESAPKVAGFEQRFQQIQVLGSLLNEQISQLSREMAASRKSAMA